MKIIESLKELEAFEQEVKSWRRSLLERLKKEEPITKETQALIENLEQHLKE